MLTPPDAASPARLRLAAVLLAGALLAACSTGDRGTPAAASGVSEPPTSSAAVSAPVSPASPSPATPPAPPEPDADRAMEHIRQLSVEIGARPAGTLQERAAASYLAKTLQDAGYEVTIEEFPFEATFDQSSVTLPGGVVLDALAMRGGADGSASGLLVFGGIGRAADLEGIQMRGRIVLFDRGVLPFADKVRAAEAGGAAAVIVVNHERGAFRGTLGDAASPLPVLAIAGEHRAALLSVLDQAVTVTADSRMKPGVSQNVVATTGDGCRAYLGGHYDSVPEAPGANDNASGVAVVLEVARARITPGLCVVLFGAEELGLWGSRAYVAQHAVDTTLFLLNVDMAGVLDSPAIVGDRGLTRRILELYEAAGVTLPLRAGAFPPFSSSDHVSFSAAGVPAVTFHSGDDPAMHSSDDTFERIDREAIRIILAGVDLALTGLMETATTP